MFSSHGYSTTTHGRHYLHVSRFLSGVILVADRSSQCRKTCSRNRHRHELILASYASFLDLRCINLCFLLSLFTRYSFSMLYLTKTMPGFRHRNEFKSTHTARQRARCQEPSETFGLMRLILWVHSGFEMTNSVWDGNNYKQKHCLL